MQIKLSELCRQSRSPINLACNNLSLMFTVVFARFIYPSALHLQKKVISPHAIRS